MNKIEFGEWLKKQIDDLGINEAELSRRSRIDISVINRTIRGETMPKIDTLRKIAHGLRITEERIIKVISSSPSEIGIDGDLAKWEFVLRKLLPEDRDWLLQSIYLRLEQQNK